MTLSVMYHIRLLQISNGLYEVLLEVRVIHFVFTLDHSLEGGQLFHPHQMFDSFLRLAINEIQSQIPVHRVLVKYCFVTRSAGSFSDIVN
jgi:hypothetical protein